MVFLIGCFQFYVFVTVMYYVTFKFDAVISTLNSALLSRDTLQLSIVFFFQKKKLQLFIIVP